MMMIMIRSLLSRLYSNSSRCHSVRSGLLARINTEVFIAMAKALDFIDPEKLSMTVVLTAMNRFLNETDGSRT